MKSRGLRRAPSRTFLYGCTAFTAAAVMASGALAQAAPAAPEEGATLTEIVVTAQKREQSIQDVPISISAVQSDVLQANRITNVGQLAAISPGLTARPSAGGSNIPSFTMRGVTSYGVVPGSDKSVSLYIDGVYIGSATGSIFDLPDVERIEVLRGPQGTLFGRNATAGAVSIITRNPTGEFGMRQEVTVGNYDQVRSRTRIDFPQMGPFSATVDYVHDQRRGDVKNLGAGTVWDRAANSDRSRQGVQVSPKWLGSKNLDQWFAAVRFEPTDNFNVLYKFDWSENHDTPEAQAIVAYDPSQTLIGPLLQSLINSSSNPLPFAADGKRPDAVNNNFATGSYQRVFGHNVTASWRASDHVSVKNILAYRESFNYGNSQIDGLGGLTLTPAALGNYSTFVVASNLASQIGTTVSIPQLIAAIGNTATSLSPLLGQPFSVIASQSQSIAKQWSDEVQVNYDSKYLTLTTGAMYFHLFTTAGAPPGLIGSTQFQPIPDGIIPAGAATSYNYAESLAAYTQAEFHATSQVDLVFGYRLSQDKKSGTYYSTLTTASLDAADNLLLTTTPVNSSFTYKKTKPSYNAGINYKPNRDILVYGKYSTGFVSGGSVGPVAFLPETAHSWEGGFKADLLGNRLRTNMAIWKVRYSDLQSAQAGSNVGHPEFSTVVIDNGSLKAHGFEAEVTAVPIRGLTLNGGLGFTEGHYLDQNPILGPVVNNPTLMPKYTLNLAAQYETEPLFGTEARGVFRIDTNWHSRMLFINSALALPAQYDPMIFSPKPWIVNTRLALKDISLGRTKAEVALWARNLTNDRSAQFPLGFGNPPFLISSSFQQARTFGMDINFDY
jgi:iron complex outermembrane receptor protein